MKGWRCKVRRPKEEGFTVVEILVVLALMGLVAAIAMPDLRGHYARYELRTAAFRVAADLRDLEQLAASHRARGLDPETSSYNVRFYPSSNGYQLNQVGGWSRMVYLPPTVELVGTNIHEGDPLNEHRLMFSMRGTPDVGGTITLRSRRTGELLYVIIAPVTGRVRVSPSPPGADHS